MDERNVAIDNCILNLIADVPFPVYFDHVGNSDVKLPKDYVIGRAVLGPLTLLHAQGHPKELVGSIEEYQEKVTSE